MLSNWPSVRLVSGKADDDVQLLVAIVGPVGADIQPLGDHLDEPADYRHVGAEAARLLMVDLQFPFDARNRAAVLDIAQAFHLLDPRAYQVDQRVQTFPVVRGQLDMDRFADRRSAFLFPGLDDDARDIGAARLDVSQNFVGRPALVPLDEIQRNRADYIFSFLGAAFPLAAGGIDGDELTLFLGDIQHMGFDPGNEFVLLQGRQVAARMNLHHWRGLVRPRGRTPRPFPNVA